MTTIPVRVAIVEDSTEVRTGIAALIESSDGFSCVGAFGDAEAALAAMTRLAPDVILMDIGLPGMSGIDAARLSRERHPATQVMMLTVYDDDAQVFESLRAGATGYILKATPPNDLLAAIGAVHQGGSPMSSRIARRVVEVFHKPRQGEDPAVDLTARERQILELLAGGHRYLEIGEALGIRLDTVRTHIRHIYEKMHVRSRTEATARYLKHRG